MSMSFKRAPLRALSLVGPARRARRPIRDIPSSVAQLSTAPAHPAGSLSRANLPSLASSAPYSLMCWWVDEPKFATTSANPVLAVQLDLYERRISLRGRVDDENVEVLAEVATTLIALNPGDSTVDITGVSVIGTAALACIANLGTELAAVGADLEVVGAAARQRRRFGLGSLSRLREAA